MAEYITEYCHFFTATNLELKMLLHRDAHKDIVIESMRYLVKNRRVIIYGFVNDFTDEDNLFEIAFA
jgi:hypothetical protein